MHHSTQLQKPCNVLLRYRLMLTLGQMFTLIRVQLLRQVIIKWYLQLDQVWMEDQLEAAGIAEEEEDFQLQEKIVLSWFGWFQFSLFPSYQNAFSFSFSFGFCCVFKPPSINITPNNLFGRSKKEFAADEGLVLKMLLSLGLVLSCMYQPVRKLCGLWLRKHAQTAS